MDVLTAISENDRLDSAAQTVQFIERWEQSNCVDVRKLMQEFFRHR